MKEECRMSGSFDVVILGGGTGGYAAALPSAEPEPQWRP
jgi:pyruvate/2-oxoglutarate dehydrogenase complex dihydrolipoamide dehydrogenase (E3) component